MAESCSQPRPRCDDRVLSCARFSSSQIRETYSAVRLLYRALDLCKLYNFRPFELGLEDAGGESLSPLAFCQVCSRDHAGACPYSSHSISPRQSCTAPSDVKLASRNEAQCEQWQALAERKGYKTQRGRGAPDPHRAGLEILKDTIDGNSVSESHIRKYHHSKSNA